MTDVIDRLAVAMNVHDLDAVAGFIHENYRSEQPAHPGAVSSRPWKPSPAVGRDRPLKPPGPGRAGFPELPWPRWPAGTTPGCTTAR